MLDALKKLIGADEEGRKRRQAVEEEERREREARVKQHAEKLRQTAEAAREAERG